MTNRRLPLLAAALCVGLAQAQSPILYSAALNTLPSAQCFTQVGPSGSLQPAGQLHVGPTQGLDYITRNDFPISFNAGFETEASFRVVSAGAGSGPGSPLRYGIQLSVVEDAGSFYAAHFSSTQIALVNTPNLAVDGINVVTTPYPVAGTHLVARIVTSATQATLFVNGVALLTVPRGTYTWPSREFYFGDGTYAADAEYLLSYVRATGVGTACNTTGVVNVASGCSGLGALTFTGSVLPGQPANATFAIPGAGGIPLLLVGPYGMQEPYCSGGCRFGLDPLSAAFAVTDTVTITLPAMSAFVGWPWAFQGARLGLVGACSFPFDHQLTDIAVMTL